MLLLGRTKDDSAYDPFPIILPGEDEPYSSSKITKVQTPEFWFYNSFYMRCKHCGNPFKGGWAENPPWVSTLITNFDITYQIVENWKYEQAQK